MQAKQGAADPTDPQLGQRGQGNEADHSGTVGVGDTVDYCSREATVGVVYGMQKITVECRRMLVRRSISNGNRGPPVIDER